MTNYGLKAGFVAYFLASIVALGPTAMLPVQVRVTPCLGQGPASRAGAWLACTATGLIRRGLVPCILASGGVLDLKKTLPAHVGSTLLYHAWKRRCLFMEAHVHTQQCHMPAGHQSHPHKQFPQYLASLKPISLRSLQRAEIIPAAAFQR